MSFLKSYYQHQRPASVDALQGQALLQVFKRCPPSTLARCRHVSREWRAVIDGETQRQREMDRLQPGSSKEMAQPAPVGRVFVCDRRRAILELLCPPSPPSSSSLRCSLPSLPARFHSDQLADMHMKSWAFRFDFGRWCDDYEVAEVVIQDLCSWMGREHGDMAVSGSSRGGGGGAGSRGSTGGAGRGGSPYGMPTPPWSGASSPPQCVAGPHAASSHSATGPTPYHLLPSSQAADCYQGLTSLSDESIAELEHMSAGRVERLAEALKPVLPLHLVLRDHALYSRRPSLLLFWFIQRVSPALRGLTLDCIRGETRLRLHEVLDLGGLDRLTVIQPEDSACIDVDERLLLAWLKVPEEKRRRIHIRLERVRMGRKAVMRFIQAWQETAEPCVFHSIVLDGNKCPSLFGGRDESEEEGVAGWRPPSPPQLKRAGGAARLRFVHCKKQAVVECCVDGGKVVIKCLTADEIRPTPVRQHRVGMPRSATAFAPLCTAGPAHLSSASLPKTRSDANMVDKLFGFLLRSNA